MTDGMINKFLTFLRLKISNFMAINETRLYFKILDTLSKDSLVNEKDITHFLAKYLPIPKEDEIEQYNKNVVSFAEKLKNYKHIEYTKNIAGEPANDGAYSKLRILASITPNGFIFLNDYKNRRSNSRVIAFQILITVLTTIFIGATVYYARLTYNLDKGKSPTKICGK